MAPPLKVKPLCEPRMFMTMKLRPVMAAWKTYSSGATNMNENSIGSVMPVRKEVRAALPMIPAMTLRRSGRASCTMASAAAGRANSMIGKKPVMKIPALLSPAM